MQAYGFKKHAVKELLRTLLETPSHIISSPTTPRQRLAIGVALQSSLELLKVDAVEDFQGPDDRQDGNVGLAADFDFQSSEEARAEIGHVLEARVAAAVVQDVPVREMEMVCFGAPEKAVEPVTEEVKERCIGDLRTYKKRKKVCRCNGVCLSPRFCAKHTNHGRFKTLSVRPWNCASSFKRV